MTRRLRNQDGFTMVEVICAMVVGLIVLAAAFDLVSKATALTTTTQDRVDASQRGRYALENIISELRSGTCVNPDTGGPLPPLAYGDGNTVEFYANTGADSTVPTRRVLTYVPAAHKITETTYTGGWLNNDPTQGKVKMPIATAGPTRTILAGVYPRDTDVPIFTYYGYQVKQTGFDDPPTYLATDKAVQLAAPVQVRATDPLKPYGDLVRVIEIGVAFRVRPVSVKSTTNSPRDAVLTGAAFARIADPTNAQNAENVESVKVADGSTTLVGPGISCS